MSDGSTWKPGDTGKYLDRADELLEGDVYRPEFFDHVQSTLKALDQELFALSRDIHGEHSNLRRDNCLRLLNEYGI